MKTSELAKRLVEIHEEYCDTKYCGCAIKQLIKDIDGETEEQEKKIEHLEAENSIMYAAIIEAANLGASAALRCKVELQRITRNDAQPETAKGNEA